jgi:hypothetical protein
MINLRRRLVPLSLLAAVALAACSSSSTASAPAAADPSIKQSVSVAPPTPTPSPEPTTNAAIEAGVRQWFIAVNKAFTTGDTKALREHTEATCACLNLAREIEKTWSTGRIVGLTWTPIRVHLVDVNYHIATVDFSFDEPSYHVINNGQISRTHRADRISVVSQFALKRGEWRMWNYSQDTVVPR